VLLTSSSYINGLDSTNITSYCVCERQAGSSDDLDDFNTVQCNLTESTQYCSGSSQSTEELTLYGVIDHHWFNFFS
jgi:hypothetical protein